MNALIIGMYVAEMLEKWAMIAKLLTNVGIVCTLLLLIGSFMLDITQEAQHIKSSLNRYIRVCATITIVAGVFYVIFPKKEVVYIAMGAKVGEYAISEIAKSSKLQKISEILDKELDDILAKYETKETK